ncbi:kelch-like protein 9 [Mercenaria mercenaria]|uniref:kelch-like protein 9 n=1 Tax=Mercenaria mercenaria TaxID=6596 RepID=UPI001E1D7DE3|nr:kelch-like protein 9 [Mercenaria mercenaria]XP_045200052.1 kelch-like protein 9 [Mercenaria mercenaria]
MALENGRIIDSFITREQIDFTCQDIVAEDTNSLDDLSMEKHQCQQRLYIINRSGSGEAQYVLLNQKRTDIDSYGVRYETWRLTKNVADFGVAVIENVLYVIGGYDKINCRHLHRVVKYDPYDFSWRECSPLLKARAKFGVCVLEGKIYVCGGERSDGRVSCSSEVYDPALDQWSEAGLMVAPRKNHCCAVYESDMYCAGGDFGTRSHDNFWVYENEHWEELDTDYPLTMPRCIDRYAMCVVGHKIYFIGGVSCRVSDTSESKFTTERGIFSYTHNVSAANKRQKSQIHGLQSDIISPWSTRYPSMVRPRLSCGAQVVGKKIYVFGGCHLDTGQDVRVCECFNTEKGTWEDEFHFRKGDLSSVVTAVLEVPRRHDEEKIKYYLKWVMW